MNSAHTLFDGIAEQLRVKQKDRATIRSGLLAAGVPETMVDELVDVSLHAVEEAMATLCRTLARASDERIAFCAVGVAGPILVTQLEVLIDGAKEISRNAGFEPRKVFPANTVTGAA